MINDFTAHLIFKMNKWNSTIKIKPPRKKSKIKKIKLSSIPELTKEADKIFSIWIRIREQKCILCGTDYQLTCGHLFKRGNKLLRFDEDNCHTLCQNCNSLDNTDHDIYIKWFKKNYGAARYNEMSKTSNELHKFTRDELQKIIDDYTITGE